MTTILQSKQIEDVYIRNDGDDTSIGDLTIQKNTPILNLDDTTGTGGAAVFMYDSGTVKGGVGWDASTNSVPLALYNGNPTVPVNNLTVLSTFIQTHPTFGKIRTPSTVGGDVGTTLVTKDFYENASNLTTGSIAPALVPASAVTQHQTSIDHDTLNNFVANEHINHGSVILTAGTGLTGGGDITASRTFNVIGANSIVANANDIQLVNDAASPGNLKVYGTNVSGVKGWQDAPSSNVKNVVINGNFNVWQREVSFTGVSSGDYTADRWRKVHDGSGTHNVTRQSFTVGQVNVPNEPRFFLRYQQTVAGAGATGNRLEQRIEGVRTLAGEEVTISFYAKADTNRTLRVQLGQFEDSTGGATATVLSPVLNLTTAWQEFTYTVTLGSISGFTINESANSLDVRYIFELNTTQTVDIAKVQLEKGGIASDFENRTFGQELALCQRYYQNSYQFQDGFDDYPGGTGSQNRGHPHFEAQTSGSQIISGGVVFAVAMRASPAVTIYSPSTGTVNKVAQINGTDISGTVNTVERGIHGIGLITATVGSFNTNEQYEFQYEADAEL